MKNAQLSRKVVQKTSLIFRPEPRPSFRGTVVMAPRSSLMMSRRSIESMQTEGVGLVAVRLVTESPVLQFTAGQHLLVLVIADQAVAGDRLEVGHVPDRRRCSARSLDREEAVQEELVGHVGEDAADVDAGEPSLDLMRKANAARRIAWGSERKV